MVREDELHMAFRWEGVSLARSVLAEGESPLSERLEKLAFKVCIRIFFFFFHMNTDLSQNMINGLHSHLNTVLQITNAASDDLDA
jgi:hypothetical protein